MDLRSTPSSVPSVLRSPLHCQPEVSVSARLDLGLAKHKLLPALELPYFAGELQDTLPPVS